MATGRERDARLNQRLRGAQRVVIGDDTGFDINIGADAPSSDEVPPRVEQSPTEPSTVTAPPGNDTTQPDRRDRLNQRLRGAGRTNIEDDTGFNLNIEGIARPFGTSSPRDSRPSISPNVSKGKQPGANNAAINTMPPPPARGTARPSASPSLPERSSPSIARQSFGERVTSPIFPTGRGRPASLNRTDEVPESPVQFPSSGRRVTATTGDLSDATAKLYGAVVSSGNISQTSSPLVRKAISSKTGANRPSTHQTQRPAREVSEETEPEAEEMDEAETARFFGVKRPRTAQTVRSSQIGSDESREEPLGDGEQPKKRQKGRPVASPAIQKQPRKKTAGAGRPPKAASVRSGASRRSASGDDAAVEVTVQRFINNRREGDDEDSDDPLQENIPFANKATETVVDVLAQVCEEVVETTLGQLRRLANTTSDSVKQKEYRVKMRAIEAYREELSSRLLQHAIHLNHWHSLKKRLRSVQKQKLDLRDEILRIRGEREQVALQMDAIRIKHENDTKDSKQRLATSNTMFGVELAVQQGREELDMSPQEQKDADVANLGLLISQISDQASSSASTGGIFNQLRDFNLFLERAALALEAR